MVVQQPTVNIKSTTSISGIFGSTVVLQCTARSDPEQIISWEKENGILPAGRYEVKGDSLILKKVTEKDSGVFACIATSDNVFIYKGKISLDIYFYRDCSHIYEEGERRNGVYTIKPDDKDAFPVYCDMTTDGGGWTVFQRRQADFSVDFYRNWKDYKEGFGNLSREFWLGNEYIHRLTARTATTLRVELEDWECRKMYAKYCTFSVGDEVNDKYRLKVNHYSGNGDDSMGDHNNKPFSTKDNDNDDWEKHCAVYWQGAWWYRACYSSNLNGKHVPKSSRYYGPGWKYLGNTYHRIKRSEMKLRDQKFKD